MFVIRNPIYILLIGLYVSVADINVEWYIDVDFFFDVVKQPNTLEQQHRDSHFLGHADCDADYECFCGDNPKSELLPQRQCDADPNTDHHVLQQQHGQQH